VISSDQQIEAESFYIMLNNDLFSPSRFSLRVPHSEYEEEYVGGN